MACLRSFSRFQIPSLAQNVARHQDLRIAGWHCCGMLSTLRKYSKADITPQMDTVTEVLPWLGEKLLLFLFEILSAWRL